MEEKKFTCDCSDARVVACCGALNVGKIANQAAIQPAKEEVAGFFCLAGVGGHIKGMVKSTKEVDLMVVIDSCPVQCAAKTLQHANEIVFDKKDCSIVVGKVKEEMGYRRPGPYYA